MRKNAPINTPKIMEAFYTKDPNLVQNTSPGVNSSKRAPDDTLTEKEKNNNLSEIPSFDPVIFSTANSENIRGTIGTRGVNYNIKINKNALSLQTINTLTQQAIEPYRTSNAPIDLMERAVKIALSYVGNNEIKKGNNQGYNDPIFEEKLFSSIIKHWKKGQPWCNNFTNLIWQEAYTTGNALVPATTNQVYKNTWNTTLKKGSRFSSGTQSTLAKFGKISNSKYIITGEQARTGKLKKGSRLPRPGDLLVYKSTVLPGGHICIVIKVNIKNGKLISFDTVDGNSSSHDPRDGGETGIRKGRNAIKDGSLKVKGFLMLEETYSK